MGCTVLKNEEMFSTVHAEMVVRTDVVINEWGEVFSSSVHDYEYYLENPFLFVEKPELIPSVIKNIKSCLRKKDSIENRTLGSSMVNYFNGLAEELLKIFPTKNRFKKYFLLKTSCGSSFLDEENFNDLVLIEYIKEFIFFADEDDILATIFDLVIFYNPEPVEMKLVCDFIVPTFWDGEDVLSGINLYLDRVRYKISSSADIHCWMGEWEVTGFKMENFSNNGKI